MQRTGGNDGSYSGLRHLTDPLEDFVDVDRFALDRSMVGKRLHPVDEGDDSVGLVADQLCQLAPGRIGVLLEQLGCAADSGQRILDLMCEHRGHRRDRSSSIPMDQLAVDLFRHRTLMQRKNKFVRRLAGQRPLDRHRAAAEPWSFKQHVIFGDCIADAPNRIDERQQGAVRRHEISQQASG